MERIQSAIEKAREARRQRLGQEAATGAGAPAVPAARAAEPAAPEGPEAEAQARAAARGRTWEALPEFRPDPAHLTRNRIVTWQTAPEAVPFDVMRTKLLHQMRVNNWRRVAVTSATGACGKTMTCLNLGFSLARQTGLATMVFELDLRRPSMAKVLGLTERHQFSRVLEGEAAPEAHIARYGANLAFATNAAPVANPAELLQHAGAGRALDAIEARYAPDLMIFDMPPMLVGDDTIGFLDQVDCALLVGAAEQSTVSEIDKSEQELSAHTNVIGVVLNKCRFLEEAQNYGTYY